MCFWLLVCGGYRSWDESCLSRGHVSAGGVRRAQQNALLCVPRMRPKGKGHAHVTVRIPIQDPCFAGVFTDAGFCLCCKSDGGIFHLVISFILRLYLYLCKSESAVFHFSGMQMMFPCCTSVALTCTGPEKNVLGLDNIQFTERQRRDVHR